MTNYLDIVLPCYNPTAKCVDEVIEFVNRLKVHQPDFTIVKAWNVMRQK